jgi:hypothetical protein
VGLVLEKEMMERFSPGTSLSIANSHNAGLYICALQVRAEAACHAVGMATS